MSGTTQINNPLGAFGQTALTAQLASDRSEFRSSAAITANRVVAISTTGSVATAATDGVAALALGVCQEAASAAGEVVSVVVGGIAENVPCAGAVAAGDIVKRSVTTAGYVSATATPGVGEALGVAINASTSNTVDVWISKGA